MTRTETMMTKIKVKITTTKTMMTRMALMPSWCRKLWAERWTLTGAHPSTIGHAINNCISDKMAMVLVAMMIMAILLLTIY